MEGKKKAGNEGKGGEEKRTVAFNCLHPDIHNEERVITRRREEGREGEAASLGRCSDPLLPRICLAWLSDAILESRARVQHGRINSTPLPLPPGVADGAWEKEEEGSRDEEEEKGDGKK